MVLILRVSNIGFVILQDKVLVKALDAFISQITLLKSPIEVTALQGNKATDKPLLIY